MGKAEPTAKRRKVANTRLTGEGEKLFKPGVRVHRCPMILLDTHHKQAMVRRCTLPVHGDESYCEVHLGSAKVALLPQIRRILHPDVVAELDAQVWYDGPNGSRPQLAMAIARRAQKARKAAEASPWETRRRPGMHETPAEVVEAGTDVTLGKATTDEVYGKGRGGQPTRRRRKDAEVAPHVEAPPAPARQPTGGVNPWATAKDRFGKKS